MESAWICGVHMESMWSPWGLHLHCQKLGHLFGKVRVESTWTPHGLHESTWTPRGFQENSMGQGKVLTKTFVTQIAKHLHRERVLRKFSECAGVEEANRDKTLAGNAGKPSISFEDSDPLPLTPPEVHHHISNTQQFYENIPRWLDLHDGDLALMVCLFFHLFPISSSDLILEFPSEAQGPSIIAAFRAYI
jgi:hypothetical protein